MLRALNDVYRQSKDYCSLLGKATLLIGEGNDVSGESLHTIH